VRILSHRLQRAVAVLGLSRPVVVASAMIFVAGFMIVHTGVFLRYRMRRLLKNMMDTMGRGGREKKHKKRDNPQGANGAEIAQDCSRCIDNYLYPSLASPLRPTHSNQETLARANCAGYTQVAHLIDQKRRLRG
jgi:hypothetical protein